MLKIRNLLLATSFLVAGSVNATPIQWSGNGHYYEFVSTNVSWHEALAEAGSSSWSGMQGYLATITSQAEQDFLNSTFPFLAWIAGSDEWDPTSEADEGQWKWMAGPEKGELLTYTFWTRGEPNNCCGGGEDYLQFHWHWTGRWNDHGGPGINAGQKNGYLIEYGGLTQGSGSSVPEPAPLALFGAGLAALGWRRRRSS